MKVVIVDDEPSARRTLRECCENEPDLYVVGEYGDGNRALAGIHSHAPDLLLLDIQIEPMNGIEVARALDPEHLPLIVFVTAYDQYALEAFEVCASDYLLKPFDEKRFRECIARVRRRSRDEALADRHNALHSLLAEMERRVQGGNVPRILASLGSRNYVLDADKIELVESNRNYVQYSVGREVYQARSTLLQAEQLLQGQPMLRISRSCLVNFNRVRELDRSPRGDFIFVLECGTTVLSSEGHRESVREFLKAQKINP